MTETQIKNGYVIWIEQNNSFIIVTTERKLLNGLLI